MTRSLHLLALCLCLACGRAAPAQEPAAEAPAPPAAPEPARPGDLQAQMEAAKASSELDEAARSAVILSLEQAVASEQSTAEFAAAADQLRAEVSAAPEETARLREALAALESGEAGVLPPVEFAEGASPDQIESALASERSRASDLAREARELDTRLSELDARPQALAERLAAARRESAEAESVLAALRLRPADTARERAALAAAAARQASLLAEVAKLEQEDAGLSARRVLLELRRDLALRQAEQGRERVRTLEEGAAASLSARIGEAERLVAEALPPEIRATGPVEELAAEIQRLTGQNNEALRDLAAAEAELLGAEAALERLGRDSEQLRAQIDVAGMVNTFSRVVMELLRDLPGPETYRRAAALRRDKIASSRLAAFQAARDSQHLPPPDAELGALVSSLGPLDLPPGIVEAAEPALAELIQARRRLLQDAAVENRRLARLLGEVDLVESQILSTAATLREFLTERLLWVASSPRLDLGAFAGIGPAFAFLLSPEALGQISAAFRRASPLKWSSGILCLALLLLPRRRFRAFLIESVARTRRISSDGIGLTLRALFATAWLAAPVPAALALAGWALLRDPGGVPSVYAAGRAVLFPAAPLFLLLFLGGFCAPGGVADAHFRWPREALARCRACLKWLGLAILPAVALVSAWIIADNPAHFQGPGRIAFLAAMALASVILWKLLRGDDRDPFASEEALPPAVRLTRWLAPAAAAAPLALAIAAAAGYFLTALALAYQIQLTALLVLGGLLVHGLLSRWIVIKERRLALRHALEQRESKLKAARERRESAGSESPAPAEDAIIPEIEEDELDAETATEQTRRLIGAVVTVSVLLACWFTWSEVLPVIKYLDRLNLLGDFSLADLIALGLVAAVTAVVSKNLPGLMEIAFLRALRLDAGSRNAIVTLFQYLVVAAGAAVVFQLTGLNWAQFGWIAAALSVGLGFGLQEVVANFVSGIILLFERPIRVGDIVSIAGVDGVVTRIRIRATTITDWDRREFVVPNKEFITGTLLNWTLSSPVTRLVIPVGLAYGADTDRARELLEDIARVHPDVMDDPAPRAVFERFGDSTLDLTLRCFVPQPDKRLGATHDLHTEIHRRFAAAGLEIAFPQRDLHIRSWSAPPPPGETPR